MLKVIQPKHVLTWIFSCDFVWSDGWRWIRRFTSKCLGTCTDLKTRKVTKPLSQLCTILIGYYCIDSNWRNRRTYFCEQGTRYFSKPHWRCNYEVTHRSISRWFRPSHWLGRRCSRVPRSTTLSGREYSKWSSEFVRRITSIIFSCILFYSQTAQPRLTKSDFGKGCYPWVEIPAIQDWIFGYVAIKSFRQW